MRQEMPCRRGPGPRFFVRAQRIKWDYTVLRVIHWVNPSYRRMRPWALPSSGGHDQTLHLDVIRIPVFQPFAWLRAGWLDMRRPASLAYGALIVAVGPGRFWCFCGTQPVLDRGGNFPGSCSSAPLMSAGLCEMSRAASRWASRQISTTPWTDSNETPRRCSNSASSWPSAPPCGSASRRLVLGTVFSYRRARHERDAVPRIPRLDESLSGAGLYSHRRSTGRPGYSPCQSCPFR